MKPEERRETIERFRTGKVGILVSTQVAEEGLDIPECQLVIRFDKFNTAQSHIQGSGRARHAEAKVYYFENDPAKAQRAAKRMLEVAQDPDITPTADDKERLLEMAAAKRRRLEGKHPYGGGGNGAEVSVYNCIDVVYSYCAKVWGEAFRTDVLYEWSTDHPAQLDSVKYPTLEGLQVLTQKQVEEYWDGLNMQDVFDPTRCKRCGMKDREQMRFIFLVACRLREEGLLDKENKPTLRAREFVKQRCPLEKPPVKVSISTKFPKQSSTHGLQNPKGHLKEWCDRMWTEKGDTVLKYETKEAPGGFCSTVFVGMLKLRFEGDVCQSKKLAEQAAARKALEHPEVGPRTA